jgi:hypothetical protein
VEESNAHRNLVGKTVENLYLGMPKGDGWFQVELFENSP